MQPGFALPAGYVPPRRRATAAAREWEADERDRIADDRERIADDRERIADDRDRIADDRERLADHREEMADERETELNALATAFGLETSYLGRRAAAAIAQSQECIARSLAMIDR